MKHVTLMISSFLILAVSASAEELLLMEIPDNQNNLTLRYAVEREHVLRTPAWNVGEALPLNQDKLFSILYGKFPELTNEAIRGIELSMLTQNRWYYTVSWMKNEKIERTLVLLDGSIVEPRTEPYSGTRSGAFFPAESNKLYQGDDPMKTRELKRQTDEQMRILAPGLFGP